ncbi:MAG: hypothetical protein E7J30_08420 [Veillonella parvula]|nr:hypothetical protein [Veillonella parvula]
MRKSELMTLWNVESWSEEPYGVYFVSRRLGINRLENVGQAFKKLNISCTGYTEDDVLSLSIWEQLYVQLDELDQLAKGLIQKGIPQGESSAGHLYVLVPFDENFTAQQDVIYETL